MYSNVFTSAYYDDHNGRERKIIEFGLMEYDEGPESALQLYDRIYVQI